MRFLATLASACALVAGALAAQKPSAQRFNEFRRIGQFSSTIQLNDASYKQLTAAPRDYSVAVLLTAVAPRFGCQLCREFQPEWDIVGRSWTKGDKKAETRLIFGTLDFAEGRDTFMSVRRTTPALIAALHTELGVNLVFTLDSSTFKPLPSSSSSRPPRVPTRSRPPNRCASIFRAGQCRLGSSST